MWHKGTGIIQYDPPRGRMKKKVDWWCVINVDREITRYYRWWVEKELHVKGLCPPSWDAHISVVRGSNDIVSFDRDLIQDGKPDRYKLWKKYNSEKVEFWYEHNPQQAPQRPHRQDEEGTFWHVEVQCPRGTEIRKELGLKHDWPLHLTFGRTWF
jgi:hypothetical protein